MPLAHTVEEISLKNGARGLLINVPGTTAVGYEFSFRAGDEYAARSEIQQVAHVLEHMMFGANERYETAEEFSRDFSRYGADSNATTYSTTVDYYGTSSQRELARMLDLWQLALTRPLFTEEILAVEKENVRAEFADHADDYPQILEQRLDRALGYGHLLNGEKIATIKNVTLADVREHYHRTHTLKNMRFAIAGNVAAKRDEIITKLETWDLPQGELLPAKSDTLRAATPVCIVRPEAEAIEFSLTFALPRYLSDEEADAMSMLNHLLTGTFHSRIYGQARSRGLCYDVGSSVDRYFSGVSEWSFGGQVQPRKADELLALVQDQLRRVAAGELTQAEVDEAKSYGLGSFEMSQGAVEDLIHAYGAALSMDRPLRLLSDIPRSIMAVERETLVVLAREFLGSGTWGFGEIGRVTQEATDRHANLFGQLGKKGKIGI